MQGRLSIRSMRTAVSFHHPRRAKAGVLRASHPAPTLRPYMRTRARPALSLNVPAYTQLARCCACSRAPCPPPAECAPASLELRPAQEGALPSLRVPVTQHLRRPSGSGTARPPVGVRSGLPASRRRVPLSPLPQPTRATVTLVRRALIKARSGRLPHL